MNHRIELKYTIFFLVPGPIENLRFDEIMFSSVLLVWDSPTNPNGRLLSKIITKDSGYQRS